MPITCRVDEENDSDESKNLNFLFTHYFRGSNVVCKK